jgi:vacuolar-type H+-ATPase subunit H
MEHEEHLHNEDSGAAILLEIKESERKADQMLEDAKKQKDAILQEANAEASKMIESKQAEIAKQNEKKVSDFREKASLLREEKLAEGKSGAKSLKSKSEKNTAKAADYIAKKFEEMI